MKAISLISSETNQQIINDLNVINYIDESGYKLFREYAVDKIKIANAFKFNEVNSFDNFVKIIQSDPVTLGFKAEVLTLNNEQMKELFDFIYKITS
jgi:hypothetical protein